MSNIQAEYLHDLLFYTAKTRISNMAVVFMIVLALLLVDIYMLTVCKKNSLHFWKLLPIYREAKPKLSIKDQIVLKVVALVLLLAYSLYNFAPLCSDLSNDHYIYAYGVYERNAVDEESENWLTEDFVLITVGEETFRMKLPVGWSTYDFPEGKFCGYVWYSQASKYILTFEPVAKGS